MAVNYIINQSGIIGQILEAGTQSLTGTMVATLFLILMVIFAVAMMLRIPLEILSIIILPFCLAVGAYYSNFLIPLIVIFVYLTMLIAKNWLFR